MIDIKKLAKLTGLKLTSEQEQKFTIQLSEVVDMLDQIKNYTIEKPNYTRQSLLWLQSYPSKEGISDSNPDAILKNVAHPITGHSVEVRAFVE